MSNSKDAALVSIIMASYNSEQWIDETIESVQAQTYTNWELLITDDASTDATVEKALAKAREDHRIQVFRSEVNQGAAKTRNNSLSHAKGRYIAFLDSDDLWTAEKLEHQLAYMKQNGCAMCYTDYDIISGDGEYRKTVRVPSSVTYSGYLKGPITCTHSIVLDGDVIDRKLMVMPDIRRGQDGATWLQILKTGVTGYALHESLAKYRRHNGSLSSNKLTALKRTWFLYRKVEKLSLPYACICFVSYVINALKKYS
ncbi:MAG: glycosyltransferase [Oscillospiraceae bacterium]|nr:glycosyltransferase [Oscillospiraceae bacterium]